MKHFSQIYFNKSRNQNNIIRNSKFNGFSSVSSFPGMTDSTLNQNYKQYAVKQMNMQLDTKMLGLIAKMNDEKTFETLKSQYDEDKRILLAKTMKNLQHSNSDYSLNNHLNLKNFHTQLNKNYTYDAADNLLILSFFDKIKTRKRKVYKVKENHYIDILYQGSSSPKKSKNIPKKEKPKFDYKILLKSNSDLEAYLKRKEDSLNYKKVSFKVPIDQEEIKETIEENKTFQYNTKYSKILKNKINVHKRRKSLERKIPFIDNKAGLSVIAEENKNAKSSTNLPKIKNQSEKNIFEDKNKNKKSKIKENNFINDSDSKNDITFSSDKNSKKKDKTLTVSGKKDSIKIELLKNNIIKITKLSKEKPLSKEQDKKPQLNITKKEMSKTINTNFLKDKISPLRIRLSDNERIQYMNRLHKQKFNNVISVFNEKEKKIERKYNKINKLITELKTKENKDKSTDKDKSPKKSKKLIDRKNISSPKKTPRLLYKEWNAATGYFHFPLINKVVYKNKKNSDDIDRIKANLRKEYTNKLKRNRMEYTRRIDGKRIMKKLNDRYELERLIEYSNELKEKQRKKDQFEYYEI